MNYYNIIIIFESYPFFKKYKFDQEFKKKST